MLIGLTQQNQMPILPQTLIPTQVMSRSYVKGMSIGRLHVASMHVAFKSSDVSMIIGLTRETALTQIFAKMV
jgi:hypothetical protein